MKKKKAPRFEFYQDARAEWRWRLIAKNGRIVADSGEGYKREKACRNAADKVILIAAQAVGGVL